MIVGTLLNSLALCHFAFAIGSDTVIRLQAPRTLSGGRVLDPHLGSLSIESCYTADYFGEAGQRNEFSWNLLSNFKGDFGGLNPYVRLGGHTQDHANYSATQEQAIVNFFQGGNDEAVNVTYGPSLFKRVLPENVPANTQFVLGLNFKTLNVSIALDTARAAWQAFVERGEQHRLRMTIGNEPDQWGWSAELYEPHMTRFLTTIQSELNLPKKWFQVGDLANPPIPQLVYENYVNRFRPSRLLELGIAETDNVWTMSQHFYPFSRCSAERMKNATLPRLLNYTDLTRVMTMFEGDIEKVNAAGLDYVLGETGSVSCHGREGVSNTFGAGLYLLNYMLHGASMGIRRMFMHNGTPFFYSLWNPKTSNTGNPRTVNPIYGSFLFLSQILSEKKASWDSTSSGLRIVELEAYKADDFSAFAVYSESSNRLRSLVFIDSTVWNPPSPRSSRRIDLSDVASGQRTVTTKRFTSLGGVNATASDWNVAGVKVDNNNGKLNGKPKGVATGKHVVVNAAEAVLVQF